MKRGNTVESLRRTTFLHRLSVNEAKRARLAILKMDTGEWGRNNAERMERFAALKQSPCSVAECKGHGIYRHNRLGYKKLFCSKHRDLAA